MNLLPVSTTSTSMVVVLLAVALTAAIGAAESGERGCCPQSTRGWMLFDDGNRRVPDFWWSDSVSVEAIDVCSHGINFYFVSEEDGQPRYVALIIVKPTQLLYETRVPCALGDEPLNKRLERAQEKYNVLVTSIERLFNTRFCPEGRVDFVQCPLGDRPVISLCRGLVLCWRHGTVELRGYLDVYMTMFS